MSRTRALQCRPKQVFDHQSWWDCLFNIQEDRSNVYKADPGPMWAISTSTTPNAATLKDVADSRPRHRNGFFGLIEEFQSKLIKEQAAVAQDGGGGRRGRQVINVIFVKFVWTS
ncbi:hypothetical protein BC938DRAFT_471586 [Jimgerdemannia flammicorona]|uniref:Uncharacterized protein n=1 Tax=Jimgerdemannia flammicorona TaxID=994334 RepID=A0A433Q7U0_9FUNG|nr:hypothetical protein BC938DRAFT_471586 [Jimgerdemannia flammicorona]